MSMQETSQNSAALEALWHVREGGAGCGVGGGEGGAPQYLALILQA